MKPLPAPVRRRDAAVKRGRPARLTAQAVIDAAKEVGLASVTLAAVADRLGVSIAAIYRYVKNREELVSLAAFDVALKRQTPAEAHGDWREFARGYARSMVEWLSAEPQLIVETMNGTMGVDAEVDFIELFISTLRKSGFTGEEAIQLHHSVAMLAIGAAAGAVATRASYSAGVTRETSIRMMLDKRSPQELPEVRKAFAAYVDVGPHQWHQAIDALILGVSHARGEPTQRSISAVKPQSRKSSAKKRS